MSDGKGQNAGAGKATGDEKIEPVLIIGTISPLSSLMHSVWEFLKGPAEQIAKMARGEYEAYDVFRAVYFGHAFLYVGYMCDSKADAEFAAKSPEAANVVVAKYVTMKREKDLVGYTVVRMDERAAHIWQAYMAEGFRGTEKFDQCLAVIEEGMKSVGVPAVTFSAIRAGMGERVKKAGYREGMTLYHKVLKETEEQNIGMMV
jgi:hypothetical protein